MRAAHIALRTYRGHFTLEGVIPPYNMMPQHSGFQGALVPPPSSELGRRGPTSGGDVDILGDTLLWGSCELVMGQQCHGFTGLSCKVPPLSLELFKTRLDQPHR